MTINIGDYFRVTTNRKARREPLECNRELLSLVQNEIVQCTQKNKIDYSFIRENGEIFWSTLAHASYFTPLSALEQLALQA